MFEEVEDGFGVDTGCPKELGESNGEELLDAVFDSGYLPFPSQLTEIWREKGGCGRELWNMARK